MKKTIAQQLGVTQFPFEIRDKQGNVIYREREDGSWEIRKYDEDGQQVFHKNQNGFWTKEGYNTPENKTMKTELEEFIEWLENYNEFCYHNNKDLVYDNFGEQKILSESAKKFYSQGLAIERILTRIIEKKLVKKQEEEIKKEAIVFAMWCDDNDISDNSKTWADWYRISKNK